MNSLWAKRTASEKRLMILAGLVLVVAGYFVLTPPATSGKKLLSARDARQKYKDLDSDKAQKEAIIERLKPELGGMTFTLAPEQLVPQVVKTLQEFAKQSNIHLREIKPLRARKGGLVTKVPLSVRFSTNQFAGTVIPFLYKLEDPAGRMVVEKFNVVAADQKTKMVDVEVQIALFTTEPI